MSANLQEEVVIDESKFRPFLNFFIDSAVLYTPYTTTERKLMKLMREDSDLISEEDRRYLYHNHYTYPLLTIAAFGGLGVLCIWKLDDLVVKNTNKNTPPEPESKPEDVNKAAYSADQMKDDPLLELQLSRKKRKGNAAAQKYDYFKAASEMSKNKIQENVTGYELRVKGFKRYFLIFTVFAGMGAFYATGRSRINLYWKSKEYEGKLKDVSGAIQPGGTTSIGPIMTAVHPKPELIESIKIAEAKTDKQR